MYTTYNTYPCPYFMNALRCNPNIMYNAYRTYSYPHCSDRTKYNSKFSNEFIDEYIPFTDEMEYDSRFYFSQSRQDDSLIELTDYGPEPFVINIEEATEQNNAYRTTLWTGTHLQLTLMSINVGEDIGLEVHPHLDQFIRIEEGEGLVKMGNSENNLDFQRRVYDDFAFIIPAGKWHNLINTGNKPIKLYSIYAPPEHPHGTVHETKAIAEAAENNNGINS